MAVSCAACGMAVLRGQKFALDDCYMLHRECVGTPRSAWAVLRHYLDEVSDLQRSVRTLEMSLARERADSERLAKAVDDKSTRIRVLERDVADYQARGTTRTVEHIQRVMDRTREEQLRDRVGELESQLSDARGQIRNLKAQPKGQRHLSALEQFELRLVRQALGVAVGQGVWGFACIAAQAWLDTKDDAGARYALLELDR